MSWKKPINAFEFKRERTSKSVPAFLIKFVLFLEGLLILAEISLQKQRKKVSELST